MFKFLKQTFISLCLSRSVACLANFSDRIKTLSKHVSCGCKCKFDSKKCNFNQKWKSSKCRCDCKSSIKYHVWKEDYGRNRSMCNCEIVEYLKYYTFMKSNDLVITYDETIDAVATSYDNLPEIPPREFFN